MDARHDRDGEVLAAMGRRPCPPLGEALTSVVAAWRPVDHAALDARLDGFARPLFAAPPDGKARADALAELMAGGFRPDPGPAAGLLLDDVLETRRGHPVLIAAVAAELGRRAGWNVAACSTPRAWYAGLLVDDGLWMIDATGGADTPEEVRRHCAHELVFAVLTGLAERLTGPGEAARAEALRERLAVFPAPQPPGENLLGALWPPAEER